MYGDNRGHKQLINSCIEPCQTRIIKLKKKFLGIETSYNFLSSKYDNLLTQLTTIKGKTTEQKNDLQELKRITCHTESAVDEMAQYLRRDCVEILGAKPAENTTCANIVCATNFKIHP